MTNVLFLSAVYDAIVVSIVSVSFVVLVTTCVTFLWSQHEQ